jgi:hypothetical protein
MIVLNTMFLSTAFIAHVPLQKFCSTFMITVTIIGHLKSYHGMSATSVFSVTIQDLGCLSHCPAINQILYGVA